MEIELLNEGKKIVVKIMGTIDNNTTPRFIEEMGKLNIENNDTVLDFNNTNYITSAGLRALLMLVKRVKDHKFEIINVNSSIEEVFKMTGFDKMLNYSLKNNEVADESFITLFNQRLKYDGDKVICTYFFN